MKLSTLQNNMIIKKTETDNSSNILPLSVRVSLALFPCERRGKVVILSGDLLYCMSTVNVNTGEIGRLGLGCLGYIMNYNQALLSQAIEALLQFHLIISQTCLSQKRINDGV